MDVLLAAAEFARIVAASALGSGIAGSVLATRAARRLKRGDDVRADVDRALDALGALRDAYRRSTVGEDRDALVLQRLEDALELAAVRTTEVVAAAARAYIAVGQFYAAQGEENGEHTERQAYDLLTAALVAERNAYG